MTSDPEWHSHVRVIKVTVFLAAVAVVTAMLVLPVPDYEGITGGRHRHEDALLLLGVLMQVFATGLAVVGLAVTVVYLRWPNRWVRRLYYFLLFLIAVANTVMLVTGTWREILTGRCGACKGLWPKTMLALCLLIAVAPPVKRYLQRQA